VGAYEAALRKLGLVDRSDPMTLTLAKLIIEVAQQGERDPARIFDCAKELLAHTPSTAIAATPPEERMSTPFRRV
jgi:hypothetical protein